MSNINYARHLYTPHEVGLAGYKEAERVQNATKTGISLPHIDGCDMGEYFARLMPWEVCEILGQTHNGKTLFVDWWESAICKQLASEGRGDECVIHVSLEESLEAMSFYQHAKVLKVSPSAIANGDIPLDRMRFSMTEIDKIPIYRVADSSSKEDEEDNPELYLSNIYRIIRALKDGAVTGDKIKPAVMVLDYLQALPYDPETRKEQEDGKRRIQVRKDVYRLRQMTVHLECPIIVNVQAKQKLEGSNPPFQIPGNYDGEETSSIAQRFDRIISIWLPKTTYPIGKFVNDVGTITEELFYAKIGKQRGGFPSGKSWPLKWDYGARTLSSIYGATVAEKDAAAQRWQEQTK